MNYDLELSKIQTFINNSSEPFDDWNYDGKTLYVYNGKRTEKYSRSELIDEGIL